MPHILYFLIFQLKQGFPTSSLSQHPLVVRSVPTESLQGKKEGAQPVAVLFKNVSWPGCEPLEPQ